LANCLHLLELKRSVPYSSINPMNAHWNFNKIKKVLYCSFIAYYHVCIILPLAPMQPEGSSAVSSISLLSSRLSPRLQTISFLQGFLPNLCACKSPMWMHNVIFMSSLFKILASVKVQSNQCVMPLNIQYVKKYVWYHILFISKVDSIHSVSCSLLYSDFHMWVETCYREWVSFRSLLCSEERGACALEPV